MPERWHKVRALALHLRALSPLRLLSVAAAQKAVEKRRFQRGGKVANKTGCTNSMTTLAAGLPTGHSRHQQQRLARTHILHLLWHRHLFSVRLQSVNLLLHTGSHAPTLRLQADAADAASAFVDVTRR